MSSKQPQAEDTHADGDMVRFEAADEVPAKLDAKASAAHLRSKALKAKSAPDRRYNLALAEQAEEAEHRRELERQDSARKDRALTRIENIELFSRVIFPGIIAGVAIWLLRDNPGETEMLLLLAAGMLAAGKNPTALFSKNDKKKEEE